jgi:hypothetical protein
MIPPPQLNDRGLMPPFAERFIEPLLPLKQETSTVDVLAIIPEGCVIVTLAVAVHKFASETVTL